MEIFSEFEKIINGRLNLDMHYLASSVRMDLFLLVGNSQALSIIAFAMAARSCGTLFHKVFIWKNRGRLV